MSSAGKTCNRCQAQGKRVTGFKCGKTHNGCQARENMQPVPSAGKHVTGAKCEKMHVSEVTVGSAPGWVRNRIFYCDSELAGGLHIFFKPASNLGLRVNQKK